jgi:hypothetical protein
MEHIQYNDPVADLRPDNRVPAPLQGIQQVRKIAGFHHGQLAT